MSTKMLMTVTNVQLVIKDAVNHSGGATWKQIKDAIIAEGWTPCDWLTQVRGPLQGLIQEGEIIRVDNDGESERYVLAR
jgi:hypothetical protein